jgi:hypothetical protein
MAVGTVQKPKLHLVNKAMEFCMGVKIGLCREEQRLTALQNTAHVRSLYSFSSIIIMTE